MDAAFPLCMATDHLWRKNDVSLGSPLEDVIRLPMADIRSYPTEHNAPMVSNAIGTKLYVSASSAYFKHFLLAARVKIKFFPGRVKFFQGDRI